MDFNILSNFLGLYSNRIYKAKSSKIEDKIPNSCRVFEAMGAHYFVLVGLDFMCGMAEIRVITHCKEFDNILIESKFLKGKLAKKLFGQGDSYITTDIFYIEANSLDIDITKSYGKYIEQ